MPLVWHRKGIHGIPEGSVLANKEKLWKNRPIQQKKKAVSVVNIFLSTFR